MYQKIILLFLIVVNVLQCSESIDSDKNSSEKNIFHKLDEILQSSAFQELKHEHAQFKEKKEELGRKLEEKKEKIQKEQQKLDEALDKVQLEFNKNLEDLRKEFEQIKNKIKIKFRKNGLYSILESQKLIEALREMQEKEESPLKKTYLLTKETYDRKKFEEERKKVERRHEAIREFIRTFSQEPTTPEEKQLVNQLKESLNSYKNDWYNTKELLLPTGEYTFENEKSFQLAEEELKLKQKEKFKHILRQLEAHEKKHGIQRIIEEIEKDNTEIMHQSQAAVSSDTPVNNQKNQPLAKVLPKFRPSKI